MKNKTLILSFILGIFLIGIAMAETSYCCEKTKDGAWCQNDVATNCDTSFLKTATSCEATSYCKLGCCYDSQEGTCDQNTPQRVCNDSDGVWAEGASCEITQCTLGCCLIGDQASFVTQTRCKKLASLYGLEIEFRTDLSDEISCIAAATSEVKGACVFEEEYVTTCEFTTKSKCSELGNNDTATFHEGYLCSSDSLGTICGPTEKTTCVEGSDEVYFVDSCGNLANIYDASKINEKNYWSEIYGKEDSCNYGSSNSESRTCGNCDYYLGSLCREAKISENPSYGDYLCSDLGCELDGEKYQHGESWCADSAGIEKNLPGSKYFRLVCYAGEVTVEPCAEYRQEVCLQSDVSGFKYAACRINKWQDCLAQNESKDCENEDARDCTWLKLKNDKEVCVPTYTPGFQFWSDSNSSTSNSSSTTSTESSCSLATANCTVKYTSKLFGSKKCVENCWCLDGGINKTMESLCTSLGDCGVKKNYLGVYGFND
jgi:hypothetical protein